MTQQKWDRKVDEGWRAHRTGLTPVEARMGQEDGDAADDEREGSDRADPVRRANDRRMLWPSIVCGTLHLATPW